MWTQGVKTQQTTVGPLCKVQTGLARELILEALGRMSVVCDADLGQRTNWAQPLRHDTYIPAVNA